MLVVKFSGFCWVLTIVVVCCLIQFAIPDLCQAAYRYKDAQGNTCFTDDWRTIPPELRGSVEPPIPVERPVAANPTTVAPPAESVAVTPSVESTQPLPPVVSPLPAALSAYLPASIVDLWNNIWVRVGAFLAAAAVVVLLVLKLVEYIPSPIVGRLILLACFLGVFVFGYKLYVANMVAGYFSMKKQFVVLMEKANKREETQTPVQPALIEPPPQAQ